MRSSSNHTKEGGLHGDERPFFLSLAEEQIAAAVKCPLHGKRFRGPHFHIYVSVRLPERQPLTLLQKSTQYQTVWFTAFPTDIRLTEKAVANRTLDSAKLEGDPNNKQSAQKTLRPALTSQGNGI
jgi:hypothetical protein